MARMPQCGSGGRSSPRCPARARDRSRRMMTIPARADRMARFAAGARQVIGRVVRGRRPAGRRMAARRSSSGCSSPLRRPRTPPRRQGRRAPAPSTQPLPDRSLQADEFPTDSGVLSASDNAEAMAGRTVDGLTSQSEAGLHRPRHRRPHSGHRMVWCPQAGGGSASSGRAWGMSRGPSSTRDSRLRRAPLACVLPPVVRTAADDPSFSPD